MSFCGLTKGISQRICILCVRVIINKRSFEPFCVWIFLLSVCKHSSLLLHWFSNCCSWDFTPQTSLFLDLAYLINKICLFQVLGSQFCRRKPCEGGALDMAGEKSRWKQRKFPFFPLLIPVKINLPLVKNQHCRKSAACSSYNLPLDLFKLHKVRHGKGTMVHNISLAVCSFVFDTEMTSNMVTLSTLKA